MAPYGFATTYNMNSLSSVLRKRRLAWLYLTTQYYCLDTVETSKENVLRVVLLHPVGSIVSFPSRVR